jgi:protein-disulfide isomerase
MTGRGRIGRPLTAGLLGITFALVQAAPADDLPAPAGTGSIDAEYAKLLALVERQRAPVKPFTARLDLRGLPSIGAADAPVTVVEFGSPGCTFCKRHAATTMPALMEHVESGEISYVFYDYPVAEDHRPLIEAALCAAEQDAYLRFRDQMLTEVGTPSREQLHRLAQSVGLQSDAFGDCMDDGRQGQRVGRLVSNGRALGIKGTPTFLIGLSENQSETLSITKRIDGAQPYSVFADEIAALLEAR